MKVSGTVIGLRNRRIARAWKIQVLFELMFLIKSHSPPLLLQFIRLWVPLITHKNNERHSAGWRIPHVAFWFIEEGFSHCGAFSIVISLKKKTSTSVVALVASRHGKTSLLELEAYSTLPNLFDFPRRNKGIHMLSSCAVQSVELDSWQPSRAKNKSSLRVPSRYTLVDNPSLVQLILGEPIRVTAPPLAKAAAEVARAGRKKTILRIKILRRITPHKKALVSEPFFDDLLL